MQKGSSIVESQQVTREQSWVSRRLRVLVIDEEVPYPPNTGKRIRTWNLLKRLAKRHNITLLAYGVEQADEYGAVRNAGIGLTLVPPLAEFSGLRLYSRLFVNLLSPYPYSVVKHYTQRFRSQLTNLLATNTYDVLHCEWTPYARFVPRNSEVPSVLATHNIESQIWERRSQQATSAPAKVFFQLQASRMANFERTKIPQMSVVTAVSPEDFQQAKEWGAGDCLLVENGVDLSVFQPCGAGDPKSLLFMGSLDWFPNRDAIEYMVSEILPLLGAKDPEFALTIIGRRPPRELVERFSGTPGVNLVGEVADVRPYLERAGMLVVPLRIGGGSRIKILEALAAGKTVVSTRVGAEGLAVTDGANIRLADTPAEFSDAISSLQSSDERLRLGTNGRALVESRYSWDRSADVLEQAWDRAVRIHAKGVCA
jgi:glycosyltransferase involved in cell wall biosynthesis